MNTGILIIAHAPLASALRACVLHVFPDFASRIVALDVHADAPPQASVTQALELAKELNTPQVLVFTDMVGATPCNVAQAVVAAVPAILISGVNLPMLLRTVNYGHEPLDALVDRAVSGGVQSIQQVGQGATRQR